MGEIINLYKELNKFSASVLTLPPPVSYGFIDKFEKKYNACLPEDYKKLLSLCNGFSLMGDEIYGLYFVDGKEDLDTVYFREHHLVSVPQYKDIIPFCPDGGGSFYCFDSRVSTNGGNSNQIVFWYSNYIYTESDPPEVTHSSLSEFIEECIIGWTLEKYNYDGTERS